NYFDKILVDAPCSGLGIIQKKEEVVKWWDEKIVKNLSELQIKLLVSAIKMLKPGGEIVYSTCTLTAEENEFVLNKVLSKYPVKLIDINPSVKNINAFTSYKDENFNNDQDRKSTRLNSSHVKISYAVFCLKKKRTITIYTSEHRR